MDRSVASLLIIFAYLMLVGLVGGLLVRARKRRRERRRLVGLYVEFLSRLDPEDAEGFHHAIRNGLLLGVVTDEFLAHKLNASRSGVARWVSGRNAPHPATRKGVVGLLKKRADEMLEFL